MAMDMLKAAEAKLKTGDAMKKDVKPKAKKPKDTNNPLEGNEQPEMDAGMNDIPPPLDIKLENALDLLTDIQQDFPANSEPVSQLAGMIKQLTSILTKVSGETPQTGPEVPEGPQPPASEMVGPEAQQGAFPASPTGAGGVPF